MVELIMDNWTYFVLALLVGLLVARWIFVTNRKTTIVKERQAGEGIAAPAKRNQALIDAPTAAANKSAVPPPTPVGLTGAGETLAAAALSSSTAEGDDLTRIKGIGPKVAKLLRELGVTTFAQIAAWDESEVSRIDAQLGSFSGRIRRGDWRAQAALLAAGDTGKYEAKFGKL